MRLARSGFVWTVLKATVLFFSWLALAYFTRIIPNPDRVLGQYYLFETIVAFFVLLANGGINQATTKRVSEGDDQATYVGSSAVTTLGILLVVSAAVLAFSPLLQEQFPTEIPVVVFLLGTLWGRQAVETARATLEGFAQVELSGGLGFVEMALKLGAQILFVLSGNDLYGLLLGTLTSSLLLGTIGTGYLIRTAGRPSAASVMHLFEFGKYSFIKEFTSKFYDNVDTVAIAVLLGDAAVGLYNVAFRFSLILKIIPQAVGVVSFPEVSEKFSTGNVGRVREVIEEGLILSTMLAIPGTVGMAMLAREIVLTFYTEAFLPATTVAVLAVAISVPDAFLYVFTHVLEGMDRPDISLRAGVLLVAVNGALNVALIPVIGIDGAILASLLGISVAALYSGWQILRNLDLAVGDLPLRAVLDQGAAALVMAAVVTAGKAWTSVTPLVAVLLFVPVGVVAYFASLVAISRPSRLLIVGLLRSVAPQF